jgi:hypothetical protein
VRPYCRENRLQQFIVAGDAVRRVVDVADSQLYRRSEDFPRRDIVGEKTIQREVRVVDRGTGICVAEPRSWSVFLEFAEANGVGPLESKKSLVTSRWLHFDGTRSTTCVTPAASV